ncbi:hypothetical protein RHMOL_Rhmol08G0305700 [Rhododendron molle]|uniref:Uncharacterized protein n=1 Tax=Rhododendron molle TaxID=49168 RepID=A0ACC0MU18_RHOML|nr:hypothetical protein RHMOL_Rhmol08G0305700 [Rhododendron molle]
MLPRPNSPFPPLRPRPLLPRLQKLRRRRRSLPLQLHCLVRPRHLLRPLRLLPPHLLLLDVHGVGVVHQREG